VLHDKLIVFGGVRDKITQAKRGPPDVEPHISKKLFFLNVLEVKGGVAEGDFKFKLVTVGDSGVGKSCLLTRFVQDFYSDFHVSTIGVDFKTVVTMVKGRLVKLQLWDTAGQERFSVVTGNYYRNSDGFIFVYDATSRASFDHVEQWLGQVQQHHECGPTTIKILVGNKCDMIGELQVTEDEGRAKAEQMGAFFVATSAKTAANVDMAFLTAAQNLVEIRRKAKQQQKPAGETGGSSIGSIGLGAPASQGAPKKGNCCQGGANKGGAGSR
jgi:Ras-related protein Rab-1A